jgi:von Willebrand factor type A domain
MIRSTSLLLALAAHLAAQGPAVAPVVTPATPVAPQAPAVAVVAPATKRPIDLAICLDISGSMDGLIDAARQNLWSVVNDLATLQPAPTLRVALLTYGCSAHPAESGFVVVETDFTTDLDLVSQKLFALKTNGGDEYVARVVQKAVDGLTWSNDRGALQLMFVAGNEPATQDPQLDVAVAAKAAISRGVVVNTIFCGDPTQGIDTGWAEVAKLADGKYAAIQQDQSVAIVTPFDAQLVELSTAMNVTYLPYGAQREVWAANQVAQDSNASVLNIGAAAQRCQTKASGLYDNRQWDLVDACEDPKFELDKVKKEELPEALRKLTPVELRAAIAAQKTKRAEIKQKVDAVGKQRDAFLQEEIKKLGAAGDQRFERAVLESVRQQAEARGFRRAVKPVAPPAVPATAPAAPAGGVVPPGKAPC